jgi:hypothetical protein
VICMRQANIDSFRARNGRQRVDPRSRGRPVPASGRRVHRFVLPVKDERYTCNMCQLRRMRAQHGNRSSRHTVLFRPS